MRKLSPIHLNIKNDKYIVFCGFFVIYGYLLLKFSLVLAKASFCPRDPLKYSRFELLEGFTKT